MVRGDTHLGQRIPSRNSIRGSSPHHIVVNLSLVRGEILVESNFQILKCRRYEIYFVLTGLVFLILEYFYQYSVPTEHPLRLS